MSDDRSIAKLEAENYRLRTAISNINLRRQLKELQAGTWPLCARCQSRQAGPFGDVDGNLICGRCFFSDASPDSSEPAEDPASEPRCGERCCCTPEYLARLEAANEALSVANGSLQETIYPWQEESGMVNGCGDGEGITPTDWASARNAMDGAMARLKAENAKLRSLLTRVAAIDWIDPTRMPSTLRDDIREALKGD